MSWNAKSLLFVAIWFPAGFFIIAAVYSFLGDAKTAGEILPVFFFSLAADVFLWIGYASGRTAK